MLRIFRSFLVDGAQYVPPEPISDVISADLRPLRVPHGGGRTGDLREGRSQEVSQRYPFMAE